MESLQNEILRVKDKDRPYTETDIVYDSLVSVIDSRFRQIRKAAELFGIRGSDVPQAIFNHRARDLEKIFKFFSYTDRVDSPRIPFELLRSLSWVANHLFNEKCYTVVRLDPTYNYSILSCRREFENKGWTRYWQYAEEDVIDSETRIPVPAPNVLLLGFPSPDAGSTLVHALAAHEFGHEFAHKWAEELKRIRESIAAEVTSRYNDVLIDYLSGRGMRREGESRDDVSEKDRKYIIALIDEISKNWLREIFSDLTASRLVGPAFLAAFDRIILGHGKASETHPPAFLRRRLVLRYLQKILPEVVSDSTWSPLFDDVVSPTIPSDELYRVMVRVFDSVADKLDVMLDLIPSPLSQVKADELSRLVNDMGDHIDHLTPPSVALTSVKDVADPDKFWLLIFGAWHYRLSSRFKELRDLCSSSGDSARAEEVLGNLLLHGLQSLELQAKWKEKIEKEIRHAPQSTNPPTTNVSRYTVG